MMTPSPYLLPFDVSIFLALNVIIKDCGGFNRLQELMDPYPHCLSQWRRPSPYFAEGGTSVGEPNQRHVKVIRASSQCLKSKYRSVLILRSSQVRLLYPSLQIFPGDSRFKNQLSGHGCATRAFKETDYGATRLQILFHTGSEYGNNRSL